LLHISDALAVEDLFLMGLGLDIAGAFLLTRGVLESPARFLDSAGTYLGYNPFQLVERARGRADALLGVGSLVLGFAVQAVGYFAALATDGESPHGWLAAAIGVAVGAAAAGVVLALHRLLRERIAIRVLVHIALAFGEATPGWNRPRRRRP
jgi:hypothetical protein